MSIWKTSIENHDHNSSLLATEGIIDNHKYPLVLNNQNISQNKSQYPLVLNKQPRISQNHTDRRLRNG